MERGREKGRLCCLLVITTAGCSGYCAKARGAAPVHLTRTDPSWGSLQARKAQGMAEALPCCVGMHKHRWILMLLLSSAWHLSLLS